MEQGLCVGLDAPQAKGRYSERQQEYQRGI